MALEKREKIKGIFSPTLWSSCESRSSSRSSIAWSADVVDDAAVDTLAERLDEVVVDEDWLF